MKQDPVFTVYLPLKVLGSMDAKVPVLFGGNGESENVLHKSGAGRCFTPGNSKSLVELLKYYNQNRNLLQSEGESGAEFIKNRFNRNIMANKYLNLFKTIVTGIKN